MTNCDMPGRFDDEQSVIHRITTYTTLSPNGQEETQGDGTVLNGEFSTLQAMPEIAEALALAQQTQENQTNQPPQ